MWFHLPFISIIHLYWQLIHVMPLSPRKQIGCCRLIYPDGMHFNYWLKPGPTKWVLRQHGESSLFNMLCDFFQIRCGGRSTYVCRWWLEFCDASACAGFQRFTPSKSGPSSHQKSLPQVRYPLQHGGVGANTWNQTFWAPEYPTPLCACLRTPLLDCGVCRIIIS